MSLDPSLKTSGSLNQHRNVLTRTERIAKLAKSGKFDEGDTDPIHLPKIGNRKVTTAKKATKKGPQEEGVADEGAAADAS